MFIKILPPDAQAVLDTQIARLNMLSPADPPAPALPHSRQIDGGPGELRCHYGNRLLRVFDRRSDKLFVLLHIIEKHSRTIPAADIAQDRLEDFKVRMKPLRRRPPGAAGHDAP